MESIAVHKANINYAIVEVPEVCELSKKLYLKGKGSYLSKFRSEGSFDLDHLASVLYYIESWEEILNEFTDFNPKYILLYDVYLGNGSNFVKLQNYYDRKIKHLFFKVMNT